MSGAGVALVWVLSAAALGFSVSLILAGLLRFPRNTFLLFYVPFAGVFLAMFFRANHLGLLALIRYNWAWGLLAAALVTVVAVKNVFSQPSSSRRKGLSLVQDLFWPGIVYGMVDALLLSVLPVLAVTVPLSGMGWAQGWLGRLALGSLAFLGSIFVTVAYHIGYPEFRGPRVLGAMIGNGLFTLAYLLTMNPLAAVVPHVLMHLAAVVHGPESTSQLPPHYRPEDRGGSGRPAGKPTPDVR